MDWPLGSTEDLKTEFKRADALRDPANVARAAVGLLNAEGGVIWIGVGESAGVAVSVEAIPDPDREMSRLQDALIDLVEPAPVVGSEGEIEIAKAPFPGEPARHLLLVRVAQGRRGPYALLKQTARAFLKRSGSRLHTMTREEIAKAFKGPSGVEDRARRIEEASQRLEADLYARRDRGMRVVVRPVGDEVELALERAELVPLLQDPKRTGNRPLGWSFTSRYSDLVPLAGDAYRFGERDSVQWLEIGPRGDIDFCTLLERLRWRGETDRLWPYALLELPISIARLARTLYASHVRKAVPPDADILLGLGLFQIGKMKLSPYSPNSIGYELPERARKMETDDFVTVVLASWAELRDSPDRCAHHLVRQVYRAYGFEEDEMPQEYDRDKGELRFPA